MSAKSRFGGITPDSFALVVSIGLIARVLYSLCTDFATLLQALFPGIERAGEYLDPKAATFCVHGPRYAPRG